MCPKTMLRKGTMSASRSDFILGKKTSDKGTRTNEAQEERDSYLRDGLNRIGARRQTTDVDPLSAISVPESGSSASPRVLSSGNQRTMAEKWSTVCL